MKTSYRKRDASKREITAAIIGNPSGVNICPRVLIKERERDRRTNLSTSLKVKQSIFTTRREEMRGIEAQSWGEMR